MTIFLHEMKRNRIIIALWSAVVAFMLGVCVLIYPEMASQMTEISDMFADMGSFSAAFGMDQLNFGEFMGYFGVECGNVLGLGGAFFAAILGITALSKEEKEHTAEFLLTHPISRTEIILGKLLSVLAGILILNVSVALITVISVFAIGESVDAGAMALLLLSYMLLQIEIALVTFGISAFIRKSGVAIGLGISVMLYFMNLISNLMEEAKILKYLTPFGYADGSYIINNNSIEFKYLLPGIIFALIGVFAAFYQYNKKDIS